MATVDVEGLTMSGVLNIHDQGNFKEQRISNHYYYWLDLGYSTTWSCTLPYWEFHIVMQRQDFYNTTESEMPQFTGHTNARSCHPSSYW